MTLAQEVYEQFQRETRAAMFTPWDDLPPIAREAWEHVVERVIGPKREPAKPGLASASKSYLGDAVYADYDDYHVILTTENGIGATNTIYLEPSVALALVEYLTKRGIK